MLGKIYGEEFERFPYNKALFRELYITKTVYNNKNNYMFKVTQDILNHPNYINLEKMLFFERKMKRGVLRENALLEFFILYSKIQKLVFEWCIISFNYSCFEYCLKDFYNKFNWLFDYLIKRLSPN